MSLLNSSPAISRRRSGRIRHDPGCIKRFEDTFVRIGNLRFQISNRRSLASRTTVAVQPAASAFHGSTGLPCKLAISGSLCSTITNVAADMPNLHGTRITRETPVIRETRITLAARIDRDATVAHETTAALTVLEMTVVPLPSWGRFSTCPAN